MDEEQQRHEVCAVEGIPGLYLTDWVGASSVNEVNILNVTHILTILSTAELEQYGPDKTEGVEMRHLDLKDEPSQNILRFFNQECDWLDRVLQKGVVLVHCQQGISRSAAFVIAYSKQHSSTPRIPSANIRNVMRRLRLSYTDALENVKKSRGIVNLNPGFQEQLQVWEQCEYDIFQGDSSPADGDKRKRKRAYTAWKRDRRRKLDTAVGEDGNTTPKSASVMSPKTPVREIDTHNLIDYLEQETG